MVRLTEKTSKRLALPLVNAAARLLGSSRGASFARPTRNANPLPVNGSISLETTSKRLSLRLLEVIEPLSSVLRRLSSRLFLGNFSNALPPESRDHSETQSNNSVGSICCEKSERSLHRAAPKTSDRAVKRVGR